MVTRRDYTAEAVEAAKSVLIELTHLLGEYRDNIVLIGGWVPELLIPQKPRPLKSMTFGACLRIRYPAAGSCRKNAFSGVRPGEDRDRGRGRRHRPVFF